MIVASHLHRAIAEVGDADGDTLAACIERDFPIHWLAHARIRFGRRWRKHRRTGNRKEAAVERELEISIFRCDWVMHCYELRAIRESSFNLHFRDHLRNAAHDLIAPKKLSP